METFGVFLKHGGSLIRGEKVHERNCSLDVLSTGLEHDL